VIAILSLLDVSLTFSETKNSSQVLSFQLFTKFGMMIVELLPKSVKVWSSVIDLHYSNYCPSDLSSIPSYYFDIKNSTFSSYEIQHKIHFTIQNQTYEIILSLFDNVAEIVDNFMSHYASLIPKNYKSILLTKLYEEQTSMFLFLMKSSFLPLETENSSLKISLMNMEQRALMSELHSNHLNDYLSSMERIIPELEKKILNMKESLKYYEENRMKGEREKIEKAGIGLVSDSQDSQQQPQYDDHNGFVLSPTSPLFQQQTPRAQQPLAASKQQEDFYSSSSIPLPNIDFHEINAAAASSSPYPHRQFPPEIHHPNHEEGQPRPPLHSPKINWKMKYEETEQRLKELTRRHNILIKEYDYALNNSVKQQQVNALTIENNSLKQLTIAMKEEISSLHLQIDEIQRTALSAMEDLQEQQQKEQQKQSQKNVELKERENNNRGGSRHVEEESENKNDSNHNEFVNDMYLKYKEQHQQQQHQQQRHNMASTSSSTGSPYSSMKVSPVTPAQQQQQQMVHSSMAEVGRSASDMEYEEWKRKPFGTNDWTVNYLDIMSSSSSFSPVSSHLHLFSLIHSFRWPFLEETILEKIFHQYCIPSKGGLPLSSFIRFTKDFHIYLQHDSDNSGLLSSQHPHLSSTHKHSQQTFPLSSSSSATFSSSVNYHYGVGGGVGGGGSAADQVSVPSHITIAGGLSNGEISLIFTTVSKIDTDDNIRKNQLPVFKVKSLYSSPANYYQNMSEIVTGISSTATPSSTFLSGGEKGNNKKTFNNKGGNGSGDAGHMSSLQSSATINNSIVNTVISKNQFYISLQMLANKLYLHLIEVATGNVLQQGVNNASSSPNETASKRKEIERVAMELFIMKTVIPNIITYGKLVFLLVFWFLLSSCCLSLFFLTTCCCLFLCFSSFLLSFTIPRNGSLVSCLL
jgi:hypothetical protein